MFENFTYKLLFILHNYELMMNLGTLQNKDLCIFEKYECDECRLHW